MEQILLNKKPDWMLIHGDTKTTNTLKAEGEWLCR